MRMFARVRVSVCACVWAFASKCKRLHASACVCAQVCAYAVGYLRLTLRLWFCAVKRVFASLRAWIRGRCFDAVGQLPCNRQLGKKSPNNSLINKDEVKLYSVHKLRTQAFLWFLNLLYTFYGINIISICRYMRNNVYPNATHYEKVITITHIYGCVYCVINAVSC